MTILNHEHKIDPWEGPLLTPQEKTDLGLDPNIHYYKNGRCSLPGCNYFTFEQIIQTRRGPRIHTGKNRR